jgi:1-acyl-sn-glycerol-3-phosphate acyltransferase
LFITLLAVFFSPQKYNDLGRALLRFLVRIYGGRVQVQGLELLDRNKTYIFMPNHVSLFDVPLLGGYLPFVARGVEAAEQFRWPVIGWFARSIGNIPIERSSAHASWASLQRAALEIQGGKSIIIMPEGTRTRTGQMGMFKKLPFRLAQIAGVDIVPIGTSGLFRFKSRVSWVVRPGPILMKVGLPIPFDTFKSMTLEDLSGMVCDRINKLVEYP